MQPRNKQGEFRKRRKAVPFFIKFLFALIGVIVACGYVVGRLPKSDQKIAQQAVQRLTATEKEDRLTKAIAKLKAEVVEKLGQGEGGAVPNGMLLTLDPTKAEMVKCRKPGGKMDMSCLSVGRWQLKTDTVILWAKKLDGTVLTERQAFDLALDSNKARVFVERVLFEIPGSCLSWSYCSNNKTWFQEHIDLIRGLQEI